MLVQQKSTKFTDVKPGSTIKVSDVNNSYEPFEATVVEMKPEHGPHSIPALMVTAEHQEDPILLMGNGQTRVEVITDSGILASDQPPAGLTRLRSRIVEVAAVQFTGGAESAVNIIRWAAGKATINYRTGTDQDREALIIKTLEGDMVADIGHWVVKGTEGEFYPVKPSVVDVKYEVIEE